jgi:hypothetical protein
MVTMLVSRERLLRDRRTGWDAEHQVTHAPIGPIRVVAVTGMLLVVAVLSVIPPGVIEVPLGVASID